MGPALVTTMRLNTPPAAPCACTLLYITLDSVRTQRQTSAATSASRMARPGSNAALASALAAPLTASVAQGGRAAALASRSSPVESVQAIATQTLTGTEALVPSECSVRACQE